MNTPTQSIFQDTRYRIQNDYRSFQAEGGRAYLSFKGFEEKFREVRDSPVMGGFSFSPGLDGTTLEFPTDPYVEGQPITSTSIDKEGAESNGLGVDCFSIHGLIKELLNVEIYLFSADCRREFDSVDRDRRGLGPTGMFIALWADFTDPLVPSQSLLFLNIPVYPPMDSLFKTQRSFGFSNRKKGFEILVTFTK